MEQWEQRQLMASPGSEPFAEFRQPGWSAEQAAGPDSPAMQSASPERLIRTMGHQHRHAWQWDIITGRAGHPAGPDAVQEFRNGYLSYDANDIDECMDSILEFDAGSFAEAVYGSSLGGGVR